MRGRLIWIALMAAALVTPLRTEARAEQDETPEDQLIHSDLPLYDFSFEEVWPHHFTTDDGSFGCTSRVAFGSWTYTNFEGETEIWQIDNYGVFHCAAIFRNAPTKAELEQADTKYGLAIRLGTALHGGKRIELWAFQTGMVPGSDYILLAREPGEGIVKSFAVLQRACRNSQLRQLGRGRTMDIWTTRYCSVNSRAELFALAKRMLALQPLGKLEWVAQGPPDQG